MTYQTEDKMKNRLIMFALFIISFVFLVTSVILSFKINEIQKQVYVRDDLIKVKTDREQKTKEETNELLKSLNGLFENSSLTKDGKFDVKSFIKMHQGLKDSISELNQRLDLIRKNYGIYATSHISSENDKQVTTTTSIKGSGKVDSALILLPYFRNRLVKKDKNTWTISLTGEEFEKVQKKYEDNMFRYNSLADNYNNLIKDYNSLVKTYNTKVDFYKNMLSRMSKKGLIKIDSTGPDIEYQY